AGAEAGATSLADAVDRVDPRDLDAEDLLDSELDLGLRSARVHEERVLALVDEPVALLGHDRLQDDVARVLVQGRLKNSCLLAHAETSWLAPDFEAMNDSSAAWVKTMSSETGTS